MSLHQIGMIHQERGDYERALEFYDRSLKIAEELSDPSGVAKSVHQIGIIHQKRGDYERALEFYDRSLKIEENMGNRSGVASSHGQIGQLHIARERYDDAFQHILSALTIFIQLQSPSAAQAVKQLKRLRVKWGKEKFDAAWREGGDEDVPDFLKE
jgi:tetratricopeptide (TPR) repeat protein